MTAEIKQLTREQIGETGRMLARAFQKDPGASYIIPDATHRAALLPAMMAAIARYGYLYGIVQMSPSHSQVAPDAIGGAAIWMPPGQTESTLVRMIRSGLIDAYLRTGPQRIFRALNYVNFTEQLRRKYAVGSFWYLLMVGVEPQFQSTGIGSALLQIGVQRADTEGQPCYLETCNPANLDLYRRYDFEVVGEGDSPHNGPHVWALWRPAQA